MLHALCNIVVRIIEGGEKERVGMREKSVNITYEYTVRVYSVIRIRINVYFFYEPSDL